MIRCIALLLLAASPGAHAAAFADGWIREAPPNAKVLAGYGVLRNEGTKALVVTGARSADFDRVEIHEMRMDGGIMRMRALERIEIAPGTSFTFESGATHLMLIGPHRALHAGDMVEIELDAAEPTIAKLTVK